MKKSNNFRHQQHHQQQHHQQQQHMHQQHHHQQQQKQQQQQQHKLKHQQQGQQQQTDVSKFDTTTICRGPRLPLRLLFWGDFAWGLPVVQFLFCSSGTSCTSWDPPLLDTIHLNIFDSSTLKIYLDTLMTLLLFLNFQTTFLKVLKVFVYLTF